MLRSMYSAISGLRNNQIFMDVIGNNIANVNTTAFKGSKVSFQDVVAQTLSSGGGAGGSNPTQVGLGIALGGIDSLDTQGSLQSTGRATDLAIQGDGFFVVKDADSTYYTRDGAFNLSTDGYLVTNSGGLKVQGWLVNPATGSIDATAAPSELSIPIGKQAAGKVTSSASFKGNLNTDALTGDKAVTTLDVYDSQGTKHSVKITFEKTGANAWTWLGEPLTTGDAISPGSATSFSFGEDGIYSTSNPAAQLSVSFTGAATSPVDVTLDLSNLTQFATGSEVNVASQNGMPAAALVDFAVKSDGEIVGNYANGANQTLGQIALATFDNSRGLYSVGNNRYQTSGTSGSPRVGVAGTGARGTLVGGALESSNVDLAQQFTDLIVAERAFEANTRVITSADQMLQDLVNLKR